MVSTVQFLVILGLFFLAMVGDTGVRVVVNRWGGGSGTAVEVGGGAQRPKPGWW